MIIAGSDPNEVIDDEDIHVGYRRYQTPDFRILLDDDEDLPDHILIKLAEIREKALQKYREVML